MLGPQFLTAHEQKTILRIYQEMPDCTLQRSEVPEEFVTKGYVEFDGEKCRLTTAGVRLAQDTETYLSKSRPSD